MPVRGDKTPVTVAASRRKQAVAPPRPTRILLLETDLDESPSSQRSQIPFIRSFVDQFPTVELIAKQVLGRPA